MSTNRRHFLEKAALGTLATGFLQGCWSPFRIKSQWSNALEIEGVDPVSIKTPSSFDELKSIIKSAETAGSSLKMVGSGHSFSDVAFSDDILLKPQGLNQPLPLDRSVLKDSFKTDQNLVNVESGITIREVNQFLDSKGLALQNLGGYDAQTISGATMTGTHGSGMRFGPIHSQIRSLVLITSEDRVMLIEPTNGITDPQRFQGAVPGRNGSTLNAQLIQDDQYFNTVVVSMGSCGVVYSVIIEAQPKFWMNESRTIMTWGDLKKQGGFLQRLVSGEVIGTNPGEPRHYEIYFSPYCLAKNGGGMENHTCLLTQRFEIDEPGKLTRDEKKRGRQGDKRLDRLVHLSRHGDRLVRFLNKNPGTGAGFVETGLKLLRDKTYINRSFDVFNLGPVNEIRAYGIEMCFDLDDIIPATESLFKLARTYHDRGWIHSSPPSIRFVAGSDAHLCMTQSKNCAFIEIGMLVEANGGDQLLEGYERHFMKNFNARPHWGLDLNVLSNASQVRELYGSRWDSWLEVYRDLNKTGVFNGRFTDRLNISI